MKKLLENKKLVYGVVGVVVAVAFVVAGVLIYNDSRKELIPDTVVDLASTAYYSDYISSVTKTIDNAAEIGLVRDKDNEFFSDSNSYKRNKTRGELKNTKESIEFFLGNYKTEKTQETYRLYLDSIELGEVCLDFINHMEVALNDSKPIEVRLDACGKVDEEINTELMPLFGKVSNRVSDAVDKYMRENVPSYYW